MSTAGGTAMAADTMHTMGTATGGDFFTGYPHSFDAFVIADAVLARLNEMWSSGPWVCNSTPEDRDLARAFVLLHSAPERVRTSVAEEPRSPDALLDAFDMMRAFVRALVAWGDAGTPTPDAAARAGGQPTRAVPVEWHFDHQPLHHQHPHPSHQLHSPQHRSALRPPQQHAEPLVVRVWPLSLGPLPSVACLLPPIVGAAQGGPAGKAASVVAATLPRPTEELLFEWLERLRGVARGLADVAPSWPVKLIEHPRSFYSAHGHAATHDLPQPLLRGSISGGAREGRPDLAGTAQVLSASVMRAAAPALAPFDARSGGRSQGPGQQQRLPSGRVSTPGNEFFDDNVDIGTILFGDEPKRPPPITPARGRSVAFADGGALTSSVRARSGPVADGSKGHAPAPSCAAPRYAIAPSESGAPLRGPSVILQTGVHPFARQTPTPAHFDQPVRPSITVFQAGTGDSALLRWQKWAILIDGGPSATHPCFAERLDGVGSLSAVILTQPDPAHAAGLLGLFHPTVTHSGHHSGLHVKLHGCEVFAHSGIGTIGSVQAGLLLERAQAAGAVPRPEAYAKPGSGPMFMRQDGRRTLRIYPILPTAGHALAVHARFLVQAALRLAPLAGAGLSADCIGLVGSLLRASEAELLGGKATRRLADLVNLLQVGVCVGSGAQCVDVGGVSRVTLGHAQKTDYNASISS